jgi:hypothetical protein
MSRSSYRMNDEFSESSDSSSSERDYDYELISWSP